MASWSINKFGPFRAIPELTQFNSELQSLKPKQPTQMGSGRLPWSVLASVQLTFCHKVDSKINKHIR